MRFVVTLLIILSVVLGGCASHKSPPAASGSAQPKPASPQTKQAKAKTKERKPGKNKGESKEPPFVAKIETTGGRVARVDQKLRFVVLDYSINPLPPVEQRLNVYREGRKVGEVKVTGPAMNNNIAADILAGDAQAGDEVRAD
ncbi:MAG TPA: hypothetical protein VHH73_20095 [Verrucomicrobiae bacterium]|nr:hypothetical protein [Verrucomicrobiae bacterium]